MKGRGRIWLVLIMLLGAATGVRAGRLTLEQCVDSALVNNPAVNAAALEVEKASVLRATAFDPPKTELVLKQETTGGGGPENSVYLGQEFDFPSLYIAKRKALSAERELQLSRLRLLEAETEKEVTQAYFLMLYTARLLQLNGELNGVFSEFLRVARARLDAGESGALEVMNAERMMEKNDMERRTLEQQYEAIALTMQRLTGCSGKVVPAEEEFGMIPYGFTIVDYDFNLTRRGIAANSEVEKAEKEITVAKNEFLPALRVGAAVQAFLKGFNPYHVDREQFRKGDFMGIEVGITVPIFFGANSSRLKAANLDRQITLLNREAADAAAREEVESLWMKLISLKERAGSFTATSLPRADEIKRISTVSYELGEIDYVEFIANLETVYGIYREYADIVNDYNQTVIQLKSLQ